MIYTSNGYYEPTHFALIGNFGGRSGIATELNNNGDEIALSAANASGENTTSMIKFIAIILSVLVVMLFIFKKKKNG